MVFGSGSFRCGSGNQTQVLKLVQQALLPTKLLLCIPAPPTFLKNKEDLM